MPWIDEIGIERGFHALDRLQQLRQSFEREELALQRHQNRIRRRHGIDCEQVERRRTIDQHIGDVAGARRSAQRRQRFPQSKRAIALLADFEFDAGEIERRRRDGEPRNGSRQHDVAQGRVADQQIVGRITAAASIDAQPRRRIALGIEIEQQHVLADCGERGAEIDRRCGLADPAFLIGDGDHPRRLRIGYAARERDDVRRRCVRRILWHVRRQIRGIGHGIGVQLRNCFANRSEF